MTVLFSLLVDEQATDVIVLKSLITYTKIAKYVNCCDEVTSPETLFPARFTFRSWHLQIHLSINRLFYTTNALVVPPLSFLRLPEI